MAQTATAVSNESANAIPLGIRTDEPNGQPQDDILVEDVSTGFDVSKLDSTLHNKNKRRAFARAVNTDTPKRIVFADDEGVRENVPLRPRLVRPSERAEKGQLPDNVFVTSVEVEDGEDTWSRREKKKKRDDNGFDEMEEAEEAEVTLDYGVDETAPMDQSEAVETCRSLGAEEWKAIEERWNTGLYKTITVPLDIKVDDIVGFTVSRMEHRVCRAETFCIYRKWASTQLPAHQTCSCNSHASHESMQTTTIFTFADTCGLESIWLVLVHEQSSLMFATSSRWMI